MSEDSQSPTTAKQTVKRDVVFLVGDFFSDPRLNYAEFEKVKASLLDQDKLIAVRSPIDVVREHFGFNPADLTTYPDDDAVNEARKGIKTSDLVKMLVYEVIESDKVFVMKSCRNNPYSEMLRELAIQLGKPMNDEEFFLAEAVVGSFAKARMERGNLETELGFLSKMLSAMILRRYSVNIDIDPAFAGLVLTQLSVGRELAIPNPDTRIEIAQSLELTHATASKNPR